MKHLSFDWAVIGAGPAGIAAVGKLIDEGVNPKRILWIDPEFKVGDFGTRWSKVPSNTQVEYFTKFLLACSSFNYPSAPHPFAMQAMDPKVTCQLAVAAEPLQWVTEQLIDQVHAVKGWVEQLNLRHNQWEIILSHSKLSAKQVILTMGSEPKSLNFHEIEEISLSTALDPEKLSQQCHEQDTIAVFGSSHSAILILKTLIENCSVKKVINFYQSPLKYAVYLDGWTLHDNTGLKGTAAEWAKKYVDGEWPQKLERFLSKEENIQTQLRHCNKAIYATGFRRRTMVINGNQFFSYNEKNGIIAPGLFGLGIAFPELKIDPSGSAEYSVGLWKFMDYLNRVIPLWFQYRAS